MPDPASSSTGTSASSEPPPLTGIQWLICVIAAIGFAFDIYELLMMPLIAGPALSELLGVPPDSPQVFDWTAWIFWASAMSGGVFGLIGGYLTDRFGRRRVLVWSILLYALSALAAGFSRDPVTLLVLRCTTFIGVCIEFVAAVAWLAELFPHPRQREKVLGFTQAFSSVGGLLVTGANALAVQYAYSLPAIYGDHSAWRYTLISGVIPALPLILVRPFLPESPVWREKKEQGTLRRPSLTELFRPRFRRTTLVTTLMFACSYGAAFGAIQLAPTLIVPGLMEAAAPRKAAEALKAEIEGLSARLKTLSREAAERQDLEARLKDLTGKRRELLATAQQFGYTVQFYQEMGGLAGRFTLAFLAVWIVSRRRLLRIFQLPGLVIVPLVFLFPARQDLELFKWGIAVAGFLTVAQFSFWGNYLPRMYPVHLRGTGESFAANIGGRMVGTSAVRLTQLLVAYMPGVTVFDQRAYAAAAVAFLVYAVGSVACSFLPEPKGENLPE